MFCLSRKFWPQNSMMYYTFIGEMYCGNDKSRYDERK